MRRLGLLAALIALGACAGGGASGPVGQACVAGGREAASVRLCSCVQRVADQSLTRGEQARAARFFGEPQAAQDVRQSPRATDELFWARYRAFADRAEATCG